MYDEWQNAGAVPPSWSQSERGSRVLHGVTCVCNRDVWGVHYWQAQELHVPVQQQQPTWPNDNVDATNRQRGRGGQWQCAEIPGSNNCGVRKGKAPEAGQQTAAAEQQGVASGHPYSFAQQSCDAGRQ
jgi:hypothetical protein